jgi:hypothetical protein
MMKRKINKRRSSRTRIKGQKSKGQDKFMTNNNNTTTNSNKEQEEEKIEIMDSKKANNLISNSDLRTEPIVEDKKEKEKEEKTTTAKIPSPEVFDSSRYDAMSEMKESANMEEEGHLKEVLLSNIQKEKPIKAENVNINTDNNPSTNIDINPSPTPSISNVDPTIEERAAIIRGSKEGEVLDQNLESNNNNNKRLQEEGGRKEKQDEKEVVHEASMPITSPKYMNPWLDLANAWTDLYIESAKNAATMTEYWLGLFSKPWLGGYKKKDKGKVE